MAFAHSKGWYVSKLKEVGYIKHEGRKLESFRTYILRGLYVTHVGPITEK
ncbi:YflJ family protein [Bacillus sp. AGMB 02131]|uniref:YflJ family protein n=1 Tax=Peribacillus faecalis TaxID=2772559 RepID=A0A927H9S4_9BACI|nr:YflJ family protein [Peribacillus faecalis]MBD3107885.1 YflJ family protein [Peribacillus faecalis]